MFIPENPNFAPKCAQCESTSYEAVTSGQGSNAVTFKRCKACGHEGARTHLHPESRPPVMPTHYGYSLKGARRTF